MMENISSKIGAHKSQILASCKIYANKGISYFRNKKWQNMFTFTIANDIMCTLAEEENAKSESG